MQTLESPPWLRMLQIVLGGICITLSLVILAYIGPAILTIILILSLILLVVGIERTSVGIAMRRSSRGSSLANIILGLAVIAFSIGTYAIPDICISDSRYSGCGGPTFEWYSEDNTWYFKENITFF